MIDDVRACFDDIRARLPIAFRPLDGPAWTKARFGLGPFPALISLDSETGFVSSVLALRGFYDEAKAAALLSEMAMPRPLIHDTDYVTEPILVEYPLDFSEVTTDRALLLLLTSAQLAGGILECVPHFVEYGWQRLYSEHEFTPGEPWELLKQAPVPYYPWDDLDPEIRPRTPSEVIGNLSGGDWSDLDSIHMAIRHGRDEPADLADESLLFIRRCLFLNCEDFLRPEENRKPIAEWSVEHTLATLSRMAFFDGNDFGAWMGSFEDGTIPRLLHRLLTFENQSGAS